MNIRNSRKHHSILKERNSSATKIAIALVRQGSRRKGRTAKHQKSIYLGQNKPRPAEKRAVKYKPPQEEG